MTAVDVEEILVGLPDYADAPTLLVACGFDGVLSPDGDDRALQESSEALNVLLALPGTTVAVISRRPADEVAELMFLSGAKGGLRMVGPDDVAGLRAEVGGVALVVDEDPGSLAGLGPDDLGVLMDPEEQALPDAPCVSDADEVVEILEELARLRRASTSEPR